MTKRAIVLAVLGVSGVAQAAHQFNGPQLNGAQLNGPQLNGPQLNGAQLNGAQLNGAQLNGAQLNGLALSGVSVSDGNFSAYTNIIGHSASCAHSEGVTGTALASSCSPCATRICQYDSYCCTYSWDSICQSEANSETQCTSYHMTGANLVGTWFPATIYNSDNTSRTVWLWIYGSRYNAYTGKTAYNIDYWTDAYYDQYGVYHAGTWYNNLCPSYDKDTSYGTGSSNGYNEALMVAGTWESRFGKFFSRFNSAAYFGGGKIPGAPSGSFTFACRDQGALAKCLERDRISDTRAGDTYTACVRMTRADFCGNGLSFTQDGTQIDVSDNWSGQTLDTSGYYIWEAYWSAKGATAVLSSAIGDLRHAASTSPYGAISYLNYYASYGTTSCQYNSGYDGAAGHFYYSSDPTLVTDQIVNTF
jgi:ADYC domain-containing protein/pentapeptide repeat protein